jgi:outer membrane putative beta-barrel porin/alpha-amylase
LARLIGAALVVLTAASLRAQDTVRTAPGIQDNSFLIEEAYNQERGVVQHINTFQRQSGTWAYSFTQEWPMGGVRNQLSYTVPVLHDEGSGTGLGDVALNYRYQLVGSGATRVAFAPRLSVVLPTGSSTAGRGRGGPGFQLMLPLSVVVAPALVTHWNLGASVTPGAHGPTGIHARTLTINSGASAIWLARSWLNLLVEGVFTRDQAVDAVGAVRNERSYFVSPGVRAALNFDSGLQIVPGLAYSIGLGPSGGQGYLFLYLSFEHPFKH